MCGVHVVYVCAECICVLWYVLCAACVCVHVCDVCVTCMCTYPCVQVEVRWQLSGVWRFALTFNSLRRGCVAFAVLKSSRVTGLPDSGISSLSAHFLTVGVLGLQYALLHPPHCCVHYHTLCSVHYCIPLQCALPHFPLQCALLHPHCSVHDRIPHCIFLFGFQDAGFCGKCF